MKPSRTVLICLTLSFLVLVGGFSGIGLTDAILSETDYVPIKWAVIVMGGYNYYRDLSYNAIQRIERIMMGRGAPFDLFQDDAIVAPSDNAPAGSFSLQTASGLPKYQVLILLFDYEPYDYTSVNQKYIYWAVGNGTNAIVFNKAAQAVPALLGLSGSDVGWNWRGLRVTNTVIRTFNDGIAEYTAGTAVAMGTNLNLHTIIKNSDGMTVWFTKTWTGDWSLGMANHTYGGGNVWYVGYSLNEYAMDYSALRYQTSWNDWNMGFWGHAINFAFNNAEKMPVTIMPYKRWKAAWIIRVDADTFYWKDPLLPPESILQSGWLYDYQFCVLGYGRTSSTADLRLTSGAPPGYVGIPDANVMYTDVTGVLQEVTGSGYASKNYRAIIFSSGTGSYDHLKIDFNENMDFADDIAYSMWENITDPAIQGKLYWAKISPTASQPTSINVAWWQTPMLMQNEITNLPKWLQYGADYGISYSFHGWQHVSLNPGGSSYPTWDGDQFVLDANYIAEKFGASRYWMEEMFGGTGQGFEKDEVIISHPFNSHPAQVDSVIDNLQWVLFQYDGAEEYVGFGQKTPTSKYTLVSANEEFFSNPSRFAVLEDMGQTLYPVISTFAHGLYYNSSYSFPPYTDSIKPANPREAYAFWLNAKSMLQNTPTAYYQSGKVTLEFDANSELTDYVWRFPVQYDGKEFNILSDNRSMGQVAHTDDNYVYVEFSQGQGPQKVEVVYGTPIPTVPVTVLDVSVPNSGTTDPASGTYNVAENSLFSISAAPFSGYTFDHWELDEVNIGSANPYSFNVSTTSHAIGAVFMEIPRVDVTVMAPSPPDGGTTTPDPGTYSVIQNSIFEVSASAAQGYVFDHWEVDGAGVGSLNPYAFNVSTSFHTVEAFFNAVPMVQVAVGASSPENGGTTDPYTGVYQVPENSLFQISATPSPSYIFDHWELDGVNVGSDNPYSFDVGVLSHDVVAFFILIPSVQIDSCDSLTSWIPTAATLSIDNADMMEGTGSIVVSPVTPLPWHTYARIQKPIDLSGFSSLQVWIKVSDPTKPFRLMVATDWANYNVYTITGLLADTWVQVTINLSTPTTRIGTINFSSITFMRFDYEVQRTAATFKIDDIRAANV